MKHTKKRALVMAVAMLMVSAIVLSSATYAWFMAGTQANVGVISANVASGSSVQVSATGLPDSWTNSLNQGALMAVSTNYFSPNLNAVSTGNNVSDTSFFSGSLQTNYNFGTTPVIDTNLGSYLVKFVVYVKSATAGTVTMASSAVTGNLTTAVYVAVKEGTNAATIYAGNNGTSGYNGFVQNYTGADSNHNGIIDVGDTTPPGTKVETVAPTAGGIATKTLTFTADEEKQLTFYMWLEGQDPECKGTVTAGDVNLNLQFNAPA